jgi:hypothetical protein
MPWTVEDVDSHKKGLTPAQKAKWVAIANGVLKDCLAKKETDCDVKAIRIANSKFELDSAQGMSMLSIPGSALNFIDEEAFAKVIPLKKGDTEEDNLEMVCYGGGIIKGHWYWGDLAFDLTGMKAAKAKYPILEDHETDKKIAFSKRPKVVDNVLTIDPDSVTFLDTKESLEFRDNSKKGFPYQASIRGMPTKIQRLMEDEAVDVNGFSMKGPGTIWREWDYKETSVCVFGWDDTTSSQVFSTGTDVDLEVEVTSLTVKTPVDQDDQGGKGKMTLEELRKDHPELIAEITKEVETKFNQEKDGLVNQFQAQIDETNKKLTALDETNKSLEKQLSIRAEKDRQNEAAALIETALSKSKIPATLHDKVKRQIDYTAFVKDDVLDVAAFTKAIEDEIKDWEDRIGDKVLGFGTSKQETVPNVPSPDEFSDDDQKWVDKMVGLTGQKK